MQHAQMAKWYAFISCAVRTLVYLQARQIDTSCLLCTIHITLHCVCLCTTFSNRLCQLVIVETSVTKIRNWLFNCNDKYKYIL